MYTYTCYLISATTMMISDNLIKLYYGAVFHFQDSRSKKKREQSDFSQKALTSNHIPVNTAVQRQNTSMSSSLALEYSRQFFLEASR